MMRYGGQASRNFQERHQAPPRFKHGTAIVREGNLSLFRHASEALIIVLAIVLHICMVTQSNSGGMGYWSAGLPLELEWTYDLGSKRCVSEANENFGLLDKIFIGRRIKRQNESWSDMQGVTWRLSSHSD